MRNEIPLITTVSVGEPGGEVEDKGLWQGLAFSITAICRYFSTRFVPGVNGRFILRELLDCPTICAGGGYLNSKPYVEFVYFSQSLGAGVCDAVGVGVEIVVPPARTMRGDPQIARSFAAVPVARIVRIKRTLLPASGPRSMFAL